MSTTTIHFHRGQGDNELAVTLALPPSLEPLLRLWLGFTDTTVDPLALVAAALEAASTAGFGFAARIDLEASPYNTCMVSWERSPASSRPVLSLWNANQLEAPDLSLFWRLSIVNGQPTITIDEELPSSFRRPLASSTTVAGARGRDSRGGM